MQITRETQGGKTLVKEKITIVGFHKVEEPFVNLRKKKIGSAFPYSIPQLNQGFDYGISVKDYFIAACLAGGFSAKDAVIEADEVMKLR